MRSLFSRFRHAMALVAGAVSLGQPALAHAETSWQANDDDSLLFDVRLGKYRLGDGVRGYQTPDGVCVDMADTILALDVPVRLDKKLRRATGWAFDERHTILIDREDNSEQIGGKKITLPATAVYDTPEGWCVKVDALSRWFGVGLNADLGNAMLFVKADAKLPVELSMERRERAAKIRPMSSFDLKTLPHASQPYGGGVKPPAVDVALTMGGIRDARRGVSGNVSYEFYASGEIGPVAYDARLASDSIGKPRSLRLRAYRTDPQAGLLGPLKATQVAAGDVTGLSSTLVSEATVGRGAMVTNRPVDRPENFDTTDFRGEMPAGWDAELYRNGQLLAVSFDRANGRYEFLDVPLLYGQNRFEVVLYGPQGQVRRDERMVMVGANSIPPRKTWYWAGINQDGRDLINFGSPLGGRTGQWRGTFAVERGIDARTSVAAGLHSLYLPKVGRRNFMEAAVRRALGPTLIEFSASSDLRGGLALSGEMLAQFGNTYIGASSINAFGGYQSDRIENGVTGIHRLTADQSIKIGRAVVPVHVGVSYVEFANGRSSLDLDSRMSANFGRYTLTGELDWHKEKRPFGPDPPDRVTAGLLGNARIGRVRLRGELRAEIAPVRRFAEAKLTGEWSGRTRGRFPNDWRAEIGYDRDRDRARFGLGYIRRYDKFAVTATAEAATDGSVAAGLNLSFSFGPDPRRKGGIRVTSAPIGSQGQVLARVYRDLNADGIRQPNEPAEKNVQLTAGRIPIEAMTDENGELMIDDLTPHQSVLVGIDASSLDDPLIQPRGPGMVVTPRPGNTAIIELGLTSAGEVDGTLVRDGGGGFEGVDLELVDARGAVIGRTRSDFDGFFLFEKVPYGRYAIRVAKLSADAAGLGTDLPGQISVDTESPSFHLGTIAAASAPGDMRTAGGAAEATPQ